MNRTLGDHAMTSDELRHEFGEWYYRKWGTFPDISTGTAAAEFSAFNAGCLLAADGIDRLVEDRMTEIAEAERLKRVSFVRISELEQQVEMLRSMIHKGLEDRDRLAARVAELERLCRDASHRLRASGVWSEEVEGVARELVEA
jgi:hypothetical protein